MRGWIGLKRWRSLHRLTPAVYVLAVVHALGAGADGGTLALRLAILATTVPIAVLLVLRVRSAKAKSPRRLPAATRPQRPIGSVVRG